MKMDALAVGTPDLPERVRRRFPGRDDPRHQGQHLFPSLSPSFSMRRGQRVFTIGSCFARNLEFFLTDFDLPTKRFKASREEWPHGPLGLRNEYNAGTIAQRLLWACEGRRTADMPGTLLGTEDNTLDMLLPGARSVTRTRAIERRQDIDAIYAQLPQSQVVVITLGMTECWYDRELQTYLNRMPPRDDMNRSPGRYQFINLDVGRCINLLGEGLTAVTDIDGCHVILTVSPVPLSLTFSGRDCVTANGRSKAVLRAAADAICNRFAGRVDYFPSYEIVMSGGLASFTEDNVHVKGEVVEKIMDQMIAAYVVD